MTGSKISSHFSHRGYIGCANLLRKTLPERNIAIKLNADAIFEQAVRAGAKVTMPLDDMFWGDRYGKVEDPFGHQWSIGTHVRDVTPEEMQKAMEQMGS